MRGPSRLARTRIFVGRLLLSLLLVACASAAGAQTPATPAAGTTNVEVDPIRCWWRTTAGAVRIGEIFDLELTCAILENEAVQVVPDESRLGNAVIQMAPFEVVGGSHPADLHSGQRRFFQYHYRLRIINTDAIGKDVPIPGLSIHYRVNSRVAANTALQGRDLVYVLPPQSIRVASMVPADTPDIRDAAGESFATAEALDFRAGVFEIVGVALVALGLLMTLLVLVRIARGSRRRTPADQRHLDTGPVMGVAMKELSAVQREREQQGWSPALMDRAMAATRVAAACALGRPVNQRTVDAGVEAGGGLLVTRGPRRRKLRTLSAAVTAEDLARAMGRLPPGSPRHGVLESLRTALVTFAAAQYGRIKGDDTVLDAALASAADGAGRVKSEHLWPRPWIRRWRAGDSAVETRA
jgi:hypothetical protein